MRCSRCNALSEQLFAKLISKTTPLVFSSYSSGPFEIRDALRYQILRSVLVLILCQFYAIFLPKGLCKKMQKNWTWVGPPLAPPFSAMLKKGTELVQQGILITGPHHLKKSPHARNCTTQACLKPPRTWTLPTPPLTGGKTFDISMRANTVIPTITAP